VAPETANTLKRKAVKKAKVFFYEINHLPALLAQQETIMNARTRLSGLEDIYHADETIRSRSVYRSRSQ
jgi:hypothetical protein